MAYNNRNTRTDRFGNPYELRRMNAVINKSSGEEVDGAFVGYVEIKGDLYKIETSSMSEDKMKNGKHQRWMKVTKKPKRQNNRGGL